MGAWQHPVFWGAWAALARVRAGDKRTANIDAVGDVDGLAVVERLELRKLRAVLLDETGKAEEHVTAVAAIRLAELLEGRSCGVDGFVHVGGVGRVHARDHCLVLRVDSVELGAMALDPLVVDEEARLARELTNLESTFEERHDLRGDRLSDVRVRARKRGESGQRALSCD